MTDITYWSLEEAEEYFLDDDRPQFRKIKSSKRKPKKKEKSSEQRTKRKV